MGGHGGGGGSSARQGAASVAAGGVMTGPVFQRPTTSSMSRKEVRTKIHSLTARNLLFLS